MSLLIANPPMCRVAREALCGRVSLNTSRQHKSKKKEIMAGENYLELLKSNFNFSRMA